MGHCHPKERVTHRSMDARLACLGVVGLGVSPCDILSTSVSLESDHIAQTVLTVRCWRLIGFIVELCIPDEGIGQAAIFDGQRQRISTQ